MDIPPVRTPRVRRIRRRRVPWHLDGRGHGVGHSGELVLGEAVAEAPGGPAALRLAVAAAGSGGDDEPLDVVRRFAPAEACGAAGV